jgi:hypothetical protein
MAIIKAEDRSEENNETINQTNQLLIQEIKSESLVQSLLILEKKIEDIYSKLGSIEGSTKTIDTTLSFLSEKSITKEELQKLQDQITEPVSEMRGNVETEVVKESASFAKQLINLLEEASLKYVNEKQLKEEIHRQLLENKQKYLNEINEQKKIIQQLSEMYEEEKRKFNRLEEEHRNLRQNGENEAFYLLHNMLSKIGNLDEMWFDEKNQLFVDYLSKKGVKINDIYRVEKNINVTLDTIDMHKKYVEKITVLGEYVVTASSFILTNNGKNYIRKGKVKRLEEQDETQVNSEVDHQTEQNSNLTDTK